MATHMIDRSTWWVNSGGYNPINTGDYRHFWSISYTTDKANRKTNFTVDYYVQYCFSAYEEGSQMDYFYEVPSGTSTVYINGSSIGSISTPKLEIEKASGWRTKYVGTRTFSIKHNNDGSASFKFYGTGFGKGTATSEYSTANGNFANIPSQSILNNIDVFHIDYGISSVTFTKYVNSYYHTLQIYKDNNTFKTIDGFNSGDQITFTEAELDNIYTKIPDGTNAVFSFKLTTYTSSSKTSVVGTDTKTATGNFTIGLPTVNGAICTSRVAPPDKYIAITGDSTLQTIIKGHSLIGVEIPTSMEAVANTRKATIVEYVIEGLHFKYNKDGIDVALVEEDSEGNLINTEKYSQKDHIIIYAVDSRGTSSLPYKQKFTRYIDYEPITFEQRSLSMYRTENGISRFIETTFEGSWWQGNFGAIDNDFHTEVYYRDVEEDNQWTTLDEFVAGAKIALLDETKIDLSTPNKFKYKGPISSLPSDEADKGFDINVAYDILIAVFDSIGNRVFAATVTYGEPAIAVYKNKAALGGPYDEQLGGTQLWGDIYVNGEPYENSGGSGNAQRHAISAILANDYTDSFGAWSTYRVYFDKVTVVGDKLTYDQNTGRVIVGAGVSKVRIGGCAYYCGTKTEAENHPDRGVALPACEMRAWCTTYNADGTGIDSTPAYLKHENNNTNTSLNVPDKIFEVGEGWQIDMGVQVSINSTVTLVRKGTTLYVEVME